MQNVSEAWKKEQRKPFVPESYVEINLNVGDPAAQADASASDNGHLPISNTSQIVEETEKNPVLYAMLELNSWGLDGTREIVPNSGPYGDNGFVGEWLSGADGRFEVLPTVTISFGQVFDTVTPGLTIDWGEAYDEWAEEYRVTVYNGEIMVEQRTFTGNKEVSSLAEMDITGYDKITIEVLKWCLPYHRARIKNILIGVEKVYTKSDIMSYGHTIFADPLSLSLPKSEITFELKNLNGEYNPDNPAGVTKYLIERQSITARYGYRIGNTIEWIPAGTFYMSDWVTPQNGITATFKARDALEYMSDYYAGPNTGTLKEIVEAALEQAELPLMSDGSKRWVVDESLSSVTVPEGVDMSKYTLAEVVQLAANAGCCAFWPDRDGVLHVEKIPEGQTDYLIDRFVSYSNSEVTLTKQLKAVDINDGQYLLAVGAVGETQPINNPLISDEQAPIVAQWIADYLINRRLLSGSYRADPRLDALDRVTNQNQFSEQIVLVTEIKYTYNGAFKGSYEGRANV